MSKGDRWHRVHVRKIAEVVEYETGKFEFKVRRGQGVFDAIALKDGVTLERAQSIADETTWCLDCQCPQWKAGPPPPLTITVPNPDPDAS